MDLRQLLRAAAGVAAIFVAACGGGSAPGDASQPQGSAAALAVTGDGLFGQAGRATQLSCYLFGTGCTTSGGGTGGGTGITGFFVDAPTANALYGCNPSNTVGVTTATGQFTCGAGDTSVDFYISTGLGNAINLGNAKLPATSGQSIPVMQLAINGLGSGLKAAEILQTLDHSTSNGILDVGDIHLPQAVNDEINLYVRTSGTLPAGITTDDAFLAHVQDAETSGKVFAKRPGSTPNGFLADVVLPHLQDTLAGIANNPPPAPVVNGSTRLSGTIVVSGAGVLVDPVFGAIPWHASGGGVMNAVVSGDITQLGAHGIVFSSPGFLETATVGPIMLPNPPGGQIGPQTQTAAVPPINGNNTITVTQGFGGRSLVIPTAGAVAGCVSTNTAGSDIGLSNPLITLVTTVTCNVGFGDMVFTATTKLVGAP